MTSNSFSALGIPQPKVIRENIVARSQPVVRLMDIKYSKSDQLLIDKALARTYIKQEDIPSTSKKRFEKPSTIPQPPTKKSKKDVSCLICVNSHFGYQSDLNE
jgi:hypothetical protein